MSLAIIDAREWQNMFDLCTGAKVHRDTPAIRMVRQVLDQHPYPGDVSDAGNRWVSETALALIQQYDPDLVCLSYARHYFTARHTPLTRDQHTRMVDTLFAEVNDFIRQSGFTPVIIGTGDMTPLRGATDLSGLDGLAVLGPCSSGYAGLYNPSQRDLDQVSRLPGIQRVIPRQEWTDLFKEAAFDPAILPDHLLVAQEGWTYRTVGLRLRNPVTVPARDLEIPVSTPLGRVKDITHIKELISTHLNTRKQKIALIILEGVGKSCFPLSHDLCANGRDWYCYEPSEIQYLTLTTGSHQLFAYPSGYRYYEKEDETMRYPLSGYFTHIPQHTLGLDFPGKSLAVGNRSMFTHMAFGADICVECFARNLYNQGSLAVIHKM